jgi:hypothetical protein
MSEDSPLVAAFTVWARYGGYSTVIIYILSITITVIAFAKRARLFAYTFLALVLIMTVFLVGFQCSTAETVFWTIHVGQVAKILPYLLILYVLLKVKKPGSE